MTGGGYAMGEKKRLMLIDGHALAYRAYHAIQPLTSPSGEPTNAVYGFANTLYKAIEDLEPDYVVAAFDVGETFRHKEFPEYKATRAETPDDLRAQFDRIYQLVESLGIPVVTKEGYEADDVLGSLARKANEAGLETVIVTGDTDIFQLVEPDTRVLAPTGAFRETQLWDEKAVRERYELDPQQLADLRGLMGDSSDNIPGVKGVGLKTATKLLKEYGTLENVYAHLGQVASTRFRSALERGREEAFQSQHLATIVRDLDLPLDLEGAEWGQMDRDRVMDLMRQLGFRSLMERIPGSVQDAPAQLSMFSEVTDVEGPPAQSDAKSAYCVVDTRAKLQELVDLLQEAELVAVDTETTTTDAMRARLVGISVADMPGRAYYLPVGHDPRTHRGPQLDLEHVRELMAPVLADRQLPKAMHNAKYDMMVLARHGMPVDGLAFDTMLAAWILEPEGRGVGLKTQAFQRLGVMMRSIDELIGSGRNQLTMEVIPVAKVAPYACADADMTLRLTDVLERELREHNQWELFTEVEMPLVPVLVAMETRGMVVDREYLGRMSATLEAKVQALEQRIYDSAGHPFNPNSTQQLGQVLFDELGLPVQRRTKTRYSTDARVMDALRDMHPIVNLILEHRSLAKLKGTYVDALPELINPATGRIHTSFNQTGASTGRLSSSDPNLQNIPVRTEEGRLVRGAFAAPEGYLLLSCDYSQVELRLLAHMSEDPELIGAFQRDEDVHATTAAAVLGIPLDNVTKEQRALAKAINFGLMYGMSDYGLAARTDLTQEEARDFIETYFARFQGVKRYLEEIKSQAYEQGYVETILGRRRYFPELQSRSASSLRQRAERAAINMPIQGSAADIIKIAMIQLHDALKERPGDAAMVLQVHDELVLEVPEDDLDQVRDLVVKTMSQAHELRVPLKVDAVVGRNWMELK
jgi:DNA polymerase I